MTVTEPLVDERDRNEISASLAELHRLAPEIDERVLHGLVQSAHDQLMPASVHSFVPILIVHQVRDIVRSRQPAS